MASRTERVTAEDIKANAPPVTPHPDLEENIRLRGEYTKLFTTHEEAPLSEDVTKFYPQLANTERPINEEVRGYLKMREAKLMEELWRKERALEAKVYDYTHHRTSERNSVNLQVGRGLERRADVDSAWCGQEAARRGLTLQPPASMPLLKELLAMGHRPALEETPKQQLLDELSELRSWAPDKILGFLNDQKLHTFTHNSGLVRALEEQRRGQNLRPDRVAGANPHLSSVPLLLNNERSNSLLKGLRESGASAQKQLAILRDLPISHALKAQYVKELDVPPALKVELLKELPPSDTRDYELLRQLPLDPNQKLQMLNQMPIEPARKAAMMRELGFPPPQSAELTELKRVAAECGGGMAEALDRCTPEVRACLVGEMQLQELVNSMASDQCPALEGHAESDPAAKLEILHQLRAMDQERRELNRRLGYPVELPPPEAQLAESLLNP
eukprot:TRINITY_DN9879_c0_g1_i3.p1 TRINITY_DN9879_c0_g1~~TRINITY_DN9879_c0_g1_i3.p1  ORF type:complete len:446 (+),score=113.53 TRINITY_DN9879_c0_g1_i3:201-1538(+)